MRLDLDRVLWEQRNLGKLCYPRQADKTELYWPNANYGFAHALKAYAGYPLDLPVNAVIPHGVYHDRVNVFPGERKASLPAVLNYPDYRADAWAACSDKLVVSSASPFLYAIELHLAEFGEGESDLGGTLFLPAHSTSGIDKVDDQGALIDELDALDAAYKPITVMIHWADYNKGLHKEYTKRGYPIVSAGNQHLDGFFTRWFHLLGRHAYVASNDIGGSLYNPAAMGMETLLVGDSPDETVTMADVIDSGEQRAEYRCPFCGTVGYLKPAHRSDCPAKTMAIPVGNTSAAHTRMQRVLKADKVSMDETKAEFRHIFADGTQEDRRTLALDLLGAHHLKTPGVLREELEMVATL